jgi:hypothetical protein
MALGFSGPSEGDATRMQMIKRMLLQFLFESVETARHMSIVVSTLSISSAIHETLCKYCSANLDITHFCPVSNVPAYLTLSLLPQKDAKQPWTRSRSF